MDRKMQKEEAKRRLKMYKVLPEVTRGLGEKKRTLYVSEGMGGNFPAVLYWASNYEGLLEKVEKFEKEYNTYVYHIVLSHTVMGDMYAMLYVSAYEEEWEYDNEGLKDGYAYANVWNPSINVEEIGEIGIKPSMGGIMRTA